MSQKEFVAVGANNQLTRLFTASVVKLVLPENFRHRKPHRLSKMQLFHHRTSLNLVEGGREFVRFFQEFTGLAAAGPVLGSRLRNTSLQLPRQSVALQFPDNLN